MPALPPALLRRTLPFAIGAVLAVAVGVAASRSPSTGSASTSLVVDTPRSQVVAADPFGTYSLTWRAKLWPIDGLRTGQAAPRRSGRYLVRRSRGGRSRPQRGDSCGFALEPGQRGGRRECSGAVRLERLPEGRFTGDRHDRCRGPDPASATELVEAAADVMRARATALDPPTDVALGQAKAEAAEVIPRAIQGFTVDQLAPVGGKEVGGGRDVVKAMGLSVRFELTLTGSGDERRLDVDAAARGGAGTVEATADGHRARAPRHPRRGRRSTPVGPTR